ncbi:MAG TPA: hypothetical protein VIF09_00430 [Polyangiaceae bacterium]|jgi:hypothetical protein
MATDLGLAEEDLWGQPLQAAPALLDALMAGPAAGLRIWAPGFVALDLRSWVPVHAGIVGDAAELARLALPDRGILVAVDAAGLARAARLAEKSAPARLAPPPGFEGGLGPSVHARRAEIARARLWDDTTSAWPPGVYRVTVIAADRASDAAVVEIARAPATVDPAVRAAQSAKAPPVVSPAPDPSGGLPRYQSGPGVPAVPSEPGVVVEAERVVSAAPGSVCALRGALRARAHEAHRVSHGAVVPVTLVLTGSETPGPHIVRLNVPSFDRDVPAGEPLVTASFAVDLFRLAPLAAEPQTWFVHAFTADGRAATQAIAVVAA